MNSFDERAATWDEDPDKRARAHAVAEAIADTLPLAPDWQVLEYGCGTALLGFELLPRVGALTGADVSEGMLEVLQEKIAAAGAAERVSACRLDLLASPGPQAAFDLVCSLLTLHHVQDTAALLAAMGQVLKPGGWLAIADLDAEDGSFHGAGFDGHKGFERAALQAQVEAAGLTDVRFATVYQLRRHGRDYPLFLMTARRPG